MLPENITLPNITYEQDFSAINNGVYNFNGRSILTTAQGQQQQSLYKNTPSQGEGLIAGPISDVTQSGKAMYQSPNRRVLHTNTPLEYADRFKSRPTGRPHIIGFDGNSLVDSTSYQTRGVNGFFPSVRKRNSTPDDKSTNGTSSSVAQSRKSQKLNFKPPPLILELAPEHIKVNRPIRSAATVPAKRVTSGRSDITTRTTWSMKTQRNKPSPRPVYNNLFDSAYDNQDGRLQQLPKPKLMIGRDNPWVYRYKIKKNMNEIKKMMGSRARPVRM